MTDVSHTELLKPELSAYWSTYTPVYISWGELIIVLDLSMWGKKPSVDLNLSALESYCKKYSVVIVKWLQSVIILKVILQGVICTIPASGKAQWADTCSYSSELAKKSFQCILDIIYIKYIFIFEVNFVNLN